MLDTILSARLTQTLVAFLILGETMEVRRSLGRLGEANGTALDFGGRGFAERLSAAY
jgi:hypothetical protein